MQHLPNLNRQKPQTKVKNLSYCQFADMHVVSFSCFLIIKMDLFVSFRTLKIQVRTDLVDNDDPDATIFVGIAGKVYMNYF